MYRPHSGWFDTRSVDSNTCGPCDHSSFASAVLMLMHGFLANKAKQWISKTLSARSDVMLISPETGLPMHTSERASVVMRSHA